VLATADSPWLVVPASAEQSEIHLEDSLEQTHVRALIQSDLVFPSGLSPNLVWGSTSTYQRFTINTSVLAKLNSALFLSKS
jgi:hypothetical protein